ncbi:MAG: hypothetical protein LQ340_001267 [Diploschistes diacapsis]|nr:MAG: hypothetical protein LQ340_001267 [Diploschistes diacapsis]
MSAIPPAARLIQLSELTEVRLGAKVRFLGRVAAYSIDSGCLYLEDPVSSEQSYYNDLDSQHDSGEIAISKVVAEIDTTLVREEMRNTDTAVDTWLNVLGYVQSISGPKDKGREVGSKTAQYNGREPGTESLASRKTCIFKVRTQALLVWDAGPLNPVAYKKALKARTLMVKESQALLTSQCQR